MDKEVHDYLTYSFKFPLSCIALAACLHLTTQWPQIFSYGQDCCLVAKIGVFYCFGGHIWSLMAKNTVL